MMAPVNCTEWWVIGLVGGGMRGRGAHNGLREDEGEASKLSVKMVLIFV